ncbi:MAG: hypothetical protein ABI128_09875 [Rhodanobacter sp.]
MVVHAVVGRSIMQRDPGGFSAAGARRRDCIAPPHVGIVQRSGLRIIDRRMHECSLLITLALIP